ncbi:MAG: RNA ligase family protein [Phycisphaerales bacterium]
MTERPAILKYPRTPHLSGSRLQSGDEDLAIAPLSALDGASVVAEEKLDGSNSAVSFAPDGTLLIQSRGKYLRGGAGEADFQLLKVWANNRRGVLWETLGDRYVMYGEWLFAHHMIYYDRLPSYFIEFDVLDRRSGAFLDTASRRALLAGVPELASAPVLFEGPAQAMPSPSELIVESSFRSKTWREALEIAAAGHAIETERVLRACDPSPLAEGLYIKTEGGGVVTGRFKFVRATFRQAVDALGEHWKNRPLLPNTLSKDAPRFV